MKFTAAAVLAAAVSGAAATYGYGNNGSYVTETVTDYTTWCPYATTLTIGSSTYVVTKPTTLTVTGCTLTVTKPVTTSSYVSCETSSASVYTPPPMVNTTLCTTAPPYTSAPVYTTSPVYTQTAPAVTPTVVPTGGAGKAAALSGAGLAGIIGFAAFVL